MVFYLTSRHNGQLLIDENTVEFVLADTSLSGQNWINLRIFSPVSTANFALILSYLAVS